MDTDEMISGYRLIRLHWKNRHHPMKNYLLQLLSSIEFEKIPHLESFNGGKEYVEITSEL